MQLLGWIYLAIEMFATAAVELMDHRPEPMVARWLTWLTIAGAVTVFVAAGPAFFKSGPFAYHGLLAFYVPVVIWGAYMVLTTWYMLKELKRAPDRPPFLQLHPSLTRADKRWQRPLHRGQLLASGSHWNRYGGLPIVDGDVAYGALEPKAPSLPGLRGTHSLCSSRFMSPSSK